MPTSVTSHELGPPEEAEARCDDAGYLVAVTHSLTNKGSEAWLAAMGRKGYDFRSYPCDVSDFGSCAECAAAVSRDLGPVDILVNNAGIQRRHALVDFPQSDWDDIIATNLTAPYLVSQAVMPAMMARQRGKIIHIASLLSEFARPSVVPYTAAKGGLRQLTRGMAVELAAHNIQVNAIAPGYFATEMNRALLDDAKFDAWVKARTPAGRWGAPDEIAGLAVFLSSPAANYITGQMIFIDGGMSVAL